MAVKERQLSATHAYCRKCGSPDLQFAGSVPALAADEFSTFAFFRCEICSWVTVEEKINPDMAASAPSLVPSKPLGR